MYKIEVPAKATSLVKMPPAVPAEAPEFVQKVTGVIIADKGDTLPVSAMPVDGTFPPLPRVGRSATSPWKCRSGTQTSASSAVAACSSALML